jgi:hypothetical protein
MTGTVVDGGRWTLSLVQPARREETPDLVQLRSRNCWPGLFCRTGNRDPGMGGSAKVATDYPGCARH